MDVTKETFAEVLPGLEAALQDCEFVAIDFEMTGISLPGNGGSSRSNYGDTPQERYTKMYPISSRYNIVQMGVCVFSKSDDKGSLVARPYNFFTFPAEGEDVVMSLSATHFLKDQGMDFNKWVRQGVSYTNEAGEAYLVKKLEQEREQDRQDAEAAAAAAAGEGGGSEKSKMKLTKAADIEFVKAQMETVTAWVESEVVEGNGGGAEEEVREAARRFRELSLTRTNAFLRRALFEAIDVAYPEMVTETRNNQVVVLRLSEAEKKERDAARERARQAKLTNTVGMRLVFKALGRCGKPLVVHNGMHDLLFMMCAFNKPLPEKLVDLKGQLAECFPNVVIYDTKYISTREDLLDKNLGVDTGVEGLYHTLVVEEDGREDGAGVGPKVVLAEGFEKYAGEGEGEGEEGGQGGFAHEAGYDAYLTGAIFGRMRGLLREGGREGEVAMKLYNYRSLFETNLGGEDGLVYRKEGQMVFHLGWRKEEGQGLKNEVLMKLFGERAASVSILWVDDLSAFAVLNGEEGVREEEVLGGLKGPAAGIVRVTPFKKWLAGKEAKEGGKEGGGDEEEGALAWIMKRTMQVLGLGPGGREGGRGKRLRSV
jgi:hypothetical protein